MTTNFSKLQQPQPQKVLICFRGEDVRHKLLSVLKTELKNYNIIPLTDSDELTGHSITKIFDLIREAEIVLAIITDKSSESRWCLDELVVMMKQHKARSLVIIPIFYNVDPHNVKYQTGPFGNRLIKTEEEARSKIDQSSVESILDTDAMIQEWRQALVYIGGISGIPYIPNTDEDKFVREIRAKLQKRLQDMSQTKHIKQEKPLMDDSQEEVDGITMFLQLTKLNKSHLEDLIHSKSSKIDINHFLFLDLNSIDKPVLVQQLIEQGQAGKIVLVLLGSLEYSNKGFDFKPISNIVARSFRGEESSDNSWNSVNRETCFSFVPSIFEFFSMMFSTSPSPSPSVFISFGQEKLGKTVVSSLKDKLATNNISCVEKESFDESRVAIVVFSAGYPDSEDCLDELVQIKKRMDEGELDALPVFYDLKAKNVKKLTGWFLTRLVKIENRVQNRVNRVPTRANRVKKTVDMGNEKSILETKARIQKWREAILSISSKSDLSNENRSDAEFFNDVVTNVKKLFSRKRQKPLMPPQETIFYTLNSFLQALNYEKTDIECFKEMPNDVFSLSLRDHDTSLVFQKLTCNHIRLLSQRIAELKRFKEFCLSLS